jgi:hypothetical protein
MIIISCLFILQSTFCTTVHKKYSFLRIFFAGGRVWGRLVLGFEFKNLNFLAMPLALLYFSYFSECLVFFHSVNLRPWSSVFCIPCSWDDRQSPPHPVYFLRWSLTNFPHTHIQSLSLVLKISSSSLAGIADVSYCSGPSLCFWVFISEASRETHNYY